MNDVDASDRLEGRHPYLRENQMDSPTRVEIDLPVVIVSHYGKFVLDNHKDVEDVLSIYFCKGDIISVHVVVESTGEKRGFCDFVDTSDPRYHSTCNQVLSPDGVCWMESEHEKKRAKQLALIAEEISQ